MVQTEALDIFRSWKEANCYLQYFVPMENQRQHTPPLWVFDRCVMTLVECEDDTVVEGES